MRHDQIIAPLVVDGAIDGTMFRAWVEQALGRRWRRGARGDQGPWGTIMFLPAYSPGLNPIEQFRQLKVALRRLAPTGQMVCTTLPSRSA